jgi:hypothetical protein
MSLPSGPDKRIFNPGKRTTSYSRGRRPRSSTESMHVIFRSPHAKGAMNLRNHQLRIRKLIFKLAFRHGVRVYKFANVGNHIHLGLRLLCESAWKAYISGLTGGIARIVGFKKSRSKPRFWESRPYTRIVHWGRAYQILKDYIALNEYEADGTLPPRIFRRRNVPLRAIIAMVERWQTSLAG